MIKQFTDMPLMFFTASTILLSAFFARTGDLHGGLTQKKRLSFNGASGWLNSKQLTMSDLRGKVVLINFWTYTCINWRRTLPYIREWTSKYKDQGLVVVGVHTPEFSFEHKLENVTRAIAEMNIGYPVALDNQFEIWNSFQNQYWPALYLIDAKGKLRYQKFGEGDYAEIELQIQKLLKEVATKGVSSGVVMPLLEGVEAVPDWQNIKSPETYVGYNRTQGFASPGGIVPNNQVGYTAPSLLKVNEWGLSGEWMMGKERLVLTRAQGKIVYRFHARDLHLVMGPQISGVPIRFRMLIDGSPPVSTYGLDVDRFGNGIVVEQRMYQLVRQQGPVIDREFQIEFLDPGVEVYVFTFG